jgi:hypothetical protein
MGTPSHPLPHVPPLSPSGVLPPYLGATPALAGAMAPYPATLLLIAQRFCFTPARNKILQGFLDYRQALAGVGFIQGFQWVSGSFLEDIEKLEGRAPRDVDIVSFVKRPSGCQLDADWLLFTQTNRPLLYSDQKARYACHAFFVDLDLPDTTAIVNQTRYWFGLFSHRRGGLWKGLLQVPLAICQDDQDAKQFLTSGTHP